MQPLTEIYLTLQKHMETFTQQNINRRVYQSNYLGQIVYIKIVFIGFETIT